MAETVGDSGASGAAAGAPPASGSSGTTGAQTTAPAAATSAATPAAGATADQGPIPFERHKAILERARQEGREALARVSWAEGLTKAEYEAAIRKSQMVDQSMRDPVTFHRQLGAWLRNHPQWGPRIQAEDGSGEPAPDLVAENGQPVYSADQLRKWQAWQTKQLRAEWADMVGPLRDQQQRESAVSHAQQQAQQQMAEARTWEGFADLQPSILKRMKADGRLSLHTAYQRAYQEEYLPQQKQRLRDELVAEMNTKATAGTANPAAPAAQAQVLKDRSWEDVLKVLAKSS